MNSISGGSGGIDKYIGFLGAMDVGSRCMISDCQVLKIKLFLSSTIMQLIRGRRVLNQIIRLPKYPVCLEHLRCININLLLIPNSVLLFGALGKQKLR